MVRYTLKTVGMFLIVFLLFLGSLFFREQRLPRFIVSWLEGRFGSETCLVRINAGWFGFRHGLRLQGVRAYDLERDEPLVSPIGSVQSVTVDWFGREIEVEGLVYDRLPDAYYRPSEPTPPRAIHPDLPDLPDFKVRLVRASILGAQVDKATCRLSVRKDRLALSDVKVEFPDAERRLGGEGELTVDFAAQSIRARATGRVLHGQVPPVVDVLDFDFVQPYVKAFTKMSQPIDATFSLDGNLQTLEVDMRYDLKTPSCCYNGVPLVKAEGSVTVHTYYSGGLEQFRVGIEVPHAEDPEGRALAGKLTIDDLAGPVRLNFDAHSSLKLEDLLAVIEVIDPSVADDVVCRAAPVIAAKGRCGTSPEDLDGFDLKGTVALREGVLAKLPVRDFISSFALKRNELSYELTASGLSGGRLAGSGTVEVSLAEESAPMPFALRGTYRDGSLAEVVEAFGAEANGRYGKVEADFDLRGQSGTNCLATLNGTVSGRVTEGNLGRSKVLWGWVDDALSKLPGMSFVSDLTEASGSFAVKDGVFSTEDICVQGGLLSIQGRGSYDAAVDNLDFMTQIHLFSRESLWGATVHRLTRPVMKLVRILEFRLKGPLKNPQWSLF